MVVFTCNHCGDTLQKPKVAKHYQFRCRKVPFLTCVDCLKDFRDEEYTTHTKCITEAERYGGKDYVPKPNANKGERKQNEWICVVHNLMNGTINLSTAEKNFLNNLLKFENIPRKKVKFLNFIRNVMGNRVSMTIVESVWQKMENAHKQNRQLVKQIQKQNNGNDKSLIQSTDSNNLLDNQENIIENQNNENICKENNSVENENEKNEACKTNGDDTCEKQKKSKKRRLKSTDAQMQDEDQPTAKISKTPSLEINENENNNAPFDWKDNILNIVQAKDEISLKKLQNKIIKKYLCHVSNSHDTCNLTDEECEKNIAKFNKALKKLKKVSAICVSEDSVKLF